MARTNKYTSLNFNDIYEKKIINPNSNNNNTSKSSSSSSSSSSHKSYSLSASSRIHGNMLVLSRPSPKPQPPPPPQQHPPPSPPQIQNQQFPQLHKPSSPAQNQQFPLLHKVNLQPPQGDHLQFPQLHKVTQQPPHPQNQQPPQPQNQQPPATIQSAPLSKPADSDSISLRPQGKTGGTPSFQESKVDAVGAAKGNKFVPPHLRPGFVAREAPPSVPEFQRPKQGNYRPGSAHGIYHGSPNRFAEDGRPKTGGGYERRMRAAGPGPGPFHGSVVSDMVVLDRPRSGGSRPSSSG